MTCDGASTNRKFIKTHPSLDEDEKKKLSYKAKNLYSKDVLCVRCATSNEDNLQLLVPFIWPWEEVPTLGKLIIIVISYLANYFLYAIDQWMQHQLEHLIEVYRRTQETSKQSGLCLLPKLKREHSELTSFSGMKVYLAAQVSNALLIVTTKIHYKKISMIHYLLCIVAI